MPIQDFNDKVSVCDSTLCSCINHFSVGVSHRRWPVPVNGCSCCYQATRKLYNGVVGEIFHRQSNQCNQCWLSVISVPDSLFNFLHKKGYHAPIFLGGTHASFKDKTCPNESTLFITLVVIYLCVTHNTHFINIHSKI